ncbi:hypothetical protein K439DRAFT_1660229 [Ramaria rubella]|nr:hypothetical protein K439DRAFT_1660229 [Ramaria rubella]
MATAEEIFNTTKLDVVVPEDGHDLVEGLDIDDWLRSLASANQRDKAFFDERLLLFFTVRLPHLGINVVDPQAPPLELVVFLTRLQITLDAKYIASQQPTRHHTVTPLRGISLALPPRSHSYQKATIPVTHPSIFPPHTPHPTPQTDEADRKYAKVSSNTEGTVLESFVWGEKSREEPTSKNFALMWSSVENVWIAVYRLTVGVSFLRTSVPEPMLSLTVSATLREKPLSATPERKVLFTLVEAAGGMPSGGRQSVTVAMNGSSEPEIHEDESHGLEEVNLFDGLTHGPSFANLDLSFPSTRLGPNLRRAAYSLPPARPASPKLLTPLTASLPTPLRGTAPVLRKSFLKMLQTVSGFKIRMKSVFVPYVVIPGHDEDEGERREAGSEERTIVLSVELGNGSASRGPGSTGFVVEGVDVTVGGEGAHAILIGWGTNAFSENDVVFPLLMGPAEQFNLLYAITFLRQSEADDVADTLRSEASKENQTSSADAIKQRPVAIVIQGRPFDIGSSKHKTLSDTKGLTYPTQTFHSRWNCVLDLSSAGHSETFDVSSNPPSAEDTLPAPVTPFPATPKTARHPLDQLSSTTPSTQAFVAGSKRHTFGGLSDHGQRLIPETRYRNSTPILNANMSESPISSMPNSPSVGGGRFTATPPPGGIPGNIRFGSSTPTANISSPRLAPPPTPAYPAYPAEAMPQTPAAQSPLNSSRANQAVPQLIEPLREHMKSAGAPQTPDRRTPGAFFAEKPPTQKEQKTGDLVVSVGLIPAASTSPDQDMIHVLDTFAIEIFAFNHGERTRRFEVSYPERRRRHQQVAVAMKSEGTPQFLERKQVPGILPLENRIRVGPLRPHTCQSVRMQFLALCAGVHSISSLILTDVETGESKNLKSVMDVIIHETRAT